MEGPEVPLEHLHEEVHHQATHGSVPWISGVALSTAILAVLAAISALTKRRRFWFVSLVFGLAGVVFLVLGSMAH